MSEGPKKKLGKINVGNRLLTLNNEGRLEETTVTRVLRYEVDQWVRARIGGTIYYMTPEHPLFTNRGLVEAQNLKVGDEVLHTTISDVIAYKKMGDRNPMKDPTVAAKSHNNVDRKAQGRKIATTIAKKKDEGTYVSTWGKMNAERRKELREAASKRQLGSNNTNYAPNSPDRNHMDLKKKVAKGNYCCARCGKQPKKGEWPLEVHHRDHNNRNDDKSNFEVICKSCHSIEHEKWRNAPGFEPGHPYYPRGKQKSVHNGKLVSLVQFVDRMTKPPSLRGHRLPIVSLTCGPNPSYLADLQWHHNCDTQFSNPNDPVVSKSDLVAQLTADGMPNLVVITGGEPFIQNIVPICSALKLKWFKVQIETAGTHWIDGFEHLINVDIVCSPKTRMIHPEIRKRAAAFKYVIGADMEFEGYIPITATQPGARPAKLAAPRPGAKVYLSPLDSYDPVKNKANKQKVAELAMRYDVIAGVQLHKELYIDEPT